MVSEPIELFGPKSMANEAQQSLIGMQKKQHTRKLYRLKYSCEEVYERMDNGLCIFCDELDTPGHHDLKHKGIQIFMVDDDQACNDVEEVHQIQKAVKNPDPFVEPVKNSDPLIEPLDCASVLQVLGSVPDVLMVHGMDSHVKEVEESSQQSTNGNDKIVAHQLFDQMPNAYQKDLTVIESSNKEVLSFSHKDDRVWEPGGLPTKMDHWNWFEKELKPYGESHKVATFLYSQMQVVKSNPVEFKTFDRKRSNKTLLLEDEQDDEHEQNQVMKLISSWNNRIWEPGGLMIEHDKWNWLENYYKCGRLMRLMHWLSSMWWKESKSRELERFGACSFVDIKMWLDLCSREYKNQMLLLGYHGLEVQVLSCLQEFGEGSKMGTRIVLCWRKIASFLWFLHGKKLVYAGQKMQSMLVSDFKTWVPHFGYELRLAGTDPVLGLLWSSFENDMNRLWRGPEAVLSFNSEKMGLDWFFQRDLHKSCLDIRRMITLLCSSADYRKLNLWVDTNYCEIRPDQTHVKLQEMSCSLSEKSLVEFVGYKAHRRELLVMVVKQLTLAATKFHLKHKWRSRLLQSFSELKQRIIVSLWKSFGYLMEAHGSKYKGLGCVVEKKKLRNVEDGVKQDKNRFFGDVRTKIFMALEELHLLHCDEKRDARTLLLVEAILDVACFSMERTTLLRIILKGILLHVKEEVFVTARTTYTPTLDQVKAERCVCVSWFKLPSNSASQQITGSTPQSNEVQREKNWDDVTETEAVWGAKYTCLGYVENSLAEFCAYEVYHSPRPPELSRCKEDDESTATEPVSAIVGDNEAKAQKFSSLRTRMFSTRFYSSSCVLQQEDNYVMVLFPVAGTADISIDELRSVCKLLFGIFVLNLITEQVRDWSFFGLLLQWKWHPPPQATSEFHQAHNDKPVFHL